MKNPYPFQKQLEVGKIGENFFKSLDPKTRDVTGVPFYQDQDIDFISNDHTYEVKTDTTTTGNFFFETTQYGKTGAVFKSRAQYWVYYFSTLERAFVINLPDLQLFLMRAGRVFQERTVVGGKAQGLVVPITYVETKPFVKEIPVHYVEAESNWNAV